jgi:hypothetical protein
MKKPNYDVEANAKRVDVGRRTPDNRAPVVAPVAFARRIAPAVLLTVLAPIVAEFLLGDFSIRSLNLVLALLPLYGGGALLIREVARRTRRGWPTILLLGAAYSLLEEGGLTQSLFNPNYVGNGCSTTVTFRRSAHRSTGACLFCPSTWCGASGRQSSLPRAWRQIDGHRRGSKFQGS